MIKTERYLALDVLRGMTIAFMILVNTPGSWQYVYPPLLHAEWHGCTATDLVFPFFLFVAGTSMFFAFSRFDQKISKGSLLRIGKRVLLIFLIGLFLNSFPQWLQDWSELRIMGVLQRIAIAYGLAAILVLWLSRNQLLWATGTILVGYWFILWFFGGEDPYSLTQNAVLSVDRAIMGESHLYRGFFHEGQRIAFEPEGILSTIPSVATVILGYLAGFIIRATEKVKVPRKLLLWGVALTAAGYIWSFALPLNKPLWTSSYVLYTGGMAAILFGLLIFIIDIKGYKKWSHFFVVFGLNPLFIYALSGLWTTALWRLVRFENAEGQIISGSGWLYQQIFVPLAGNLNGSLLYAIFHVLLFWLVGYILYRYRIFIKV